jgi:hypothetical protein
MKVPCSFYRDSKALSGKLERGGDHPPNLTQADFFSVAQREKHCPKKKISEY